MKAVATRHGLTGCLHRVWLVESRLQCAGKQHGDYHPHKRQDCTQIFERYTRRMKRKDHPGVPSHRCENRSSIATYLHRCKAFGRLCSGIPKSSSRFSISSKEVARCSAGREGHPCCHPLHTCLLCSRVIPGPTRTKYDIIL